MHPSAANGGDSNERLANWVIAVSVGAEVKAVS